MNWEQNIVVPYELYELYDWGKFWNFMELYDVTELQQDFTTA